MDHDEHLLNQLAHSLSFSRAEKGSAIGYANHFSTAELKERLSVVQQSLKDAREELSSFQDNPARDRLLKRIGANGRYRTDSLTVSVLQEEDAVMKRIAHLIQQEAILSSREKNILSYIKKNESNVEEQIKAQSKQLKDFKRVNGS